MNCTRTHARGVRSLTFFLAGSLAGMAATPSAVTAQSVTVKGETLTAIGVYAEDEPQSYEIRSLRKGLVFASSLQVKAAANRSWTEALATIGPSSARVLLSGSVTGIWPHAATSKSFADRATLSGSPRFRFTFRSARPVAGRVEVFLQPRIWTNTFIQPWAAASVKVGNYPAAKVQIGTTVTDEFPVTLNSNGLHVDVELAGFATSSGGSPIRYEMEVRAKFVPLHKSTSYGSSCAKLLGSFPDKATLGLHVESASPNSQATLLFGWNPLNIGLGAGPCTLLVDPVVLLPIGRTDSTGAIRKRLTIPNLAFTILAQGAAYDPVTNRTEATQGLRLTFAKR